MSGLEIARRRMANSRLIGSPLDAPEDVIRWHGAMQAQDYGPAKWSIAQRAKGLIDVDVDQAVASGCIVRTHVLRPTWPLRAERVPAGRPFARDESLVELTRRYLTRHGPATVQDLRWWSSLTVADVRKALHLLGPEVRELSADGFTFWSMVSDDTRAPGGRGAHFLQAYDELIVGYTESRYVGDPRAEAARGAFR